MQWSTNCDAPNVPVSEPIEERMKEFITDSILEASSDYELNDVADANYSDDFLYTQHELLVIKEISLI